MREEQRAHRFAGLRKHSRGTAQNATGTVAFAGQR